MAVKISEWKDSEGKVFPHLEASGADFNEAFVEAAQGFFSLFTDLSTVRAHDRVEIFCESSDSDWLFSDWINTLIYEIRERRMLFSEFKIHVEGINVKGEIIGEKIDPKRHPLKIDFLGGAAFNRLSAEEVSLGVGKSARVSVVLDDIKRHPLPLKELWGATS